MSNPSAPMIVTDNPESSITPAVQGAALELIGAGRLSAKTPHATRDGVPGAILDGRFVPDSQTEVLVARKLDPTPFGTDVPPAFRRS